ncbi:MAG: alpha/beta hydrolase [Acidobacteria bacterium]|nr:alpha/beta hydrolase [Acidobacteriota bacterium]
MPEVKVRALEIHYEETGSGDPVVLVNGTGESGATWIGQTMDLGERYRCVTPDNRDVGRSSYVSDPYAPADMAADIAGLIERLDLGPSHVIGYSLGGAVVQELAVARPDLVRSLVLLSTWPASDGWFRAEMESWRELARRFSSTDGSRWADEEGFLRALFPRVFAPGTYETPGLIDGFLTFALAEEPAQRPEGFIRQCAADIAHDAGARLAGVRAPSLVIVGDQDICTPPRYSRALAELIPGARSVVIPDAAHCALFERPDLVNAAIMEFLAAS